MITLFLAPLAAALTTPAPATTVVGLHQWRAFAGKRFRADKVVEDSRCPMNARCVWAGRATIRLTLRDARRTRQADLTLGEAVPFADGKLTLVSVAPERIAGTRTKRPGPYRFAFEYRR